MRHLVIKAHPSSKGFTHKIASRFVSVAHDKGDEAEIIDLYNSKYDLDYFRFEDIHNVKPDKKVENIQDKIRLADNIVFVYPMWWYSFPAPVKNFLDRVISPGFGYKYVQGDMMPEKLLKGKTLQVFSTCDAPWIFIQFFNFGKKIMKTSFGLCGVKLKDYILLTSKRTRDEKYLDNFLDKVSKKV